MYVYSSTADSEFFDTPNIQVSRRDILERYIKYCEFCQSNLGPTNYSISKKKSFSVSTSILLKPIHSVMNGLHNSPKYKQLLNDLYVTRVQKGISNPSCREVVSLYMYKFRVILFSSITISSIMYYTTKSYRVNHCFQNLASLYLNYYYIVMNNLNMFVSYLVVVIHRLKVLWNVLQIVI